MKVVVVGAGYVGLVTALGLTELGHKAFCVETDPERLRTLKRLEIPFHEPGLPELYRRACERKLFDIGDDLQVSLHDADVAMIAVGTPGGSAGIDLGQVRKAAAEMAGVLPTLSNYLVVVVKSTVIPGTTDGAVRQELETASGMRVGEFGLCMNPEFLREGHAVCDFLSPDRIVIGAHDERASNVMAALYAGFTCPFVRTSLRNAEMIKYATNALLACLVSFSNEIAGLCEHVEGLDEETVMTGLHLDRRFSVETTDGQRRCADIAHYLRAGVGFGGSCLPKDIQAIEAFGSSVGQPMRLLSAIRAINQTRAVEVVDAFARNLSVAVDRSRVAVLGLAFKSDTDDVRESPALRIIEELRSRGAEVIGHDPVVTEETLKRAHLPPIRVANSLREALSGANGAIIATSWAEYRNADWAELARVMTYPLVFDGRQVISPANRAAGLVYRSTGSCQWRAEAPQ